MPFVPIVIQAELGALGNDCATADHGPLEPPPPAEPADAGPLLEDFSADGGS